MTEYLLHPGVGIGPIHLGMTQAEVREGMPTPAKPFTRGKTHVDAFDSFQVNYSANGVVDFLEIAPNPGTRLLFEGRDLLSTPMRELVALFSAHEPYTLRESTTYHFPSLRVALWRDISFDEELDGFVESISTWTPDYWT